MVLAHDGHLYASTPHSGFAPADTLLAATASGTSADLAPLLWRSPVGMDDVIAELAARRWWEPVPRRPWRWRTGYRPSALLIGSVHDPGAVALTELLMMLFRSSTDTDDLELTAARTDFGSATWLVAPVLHELVELRAWLQAAVTTHQPTA